MHRSHETLFTSLRARFDHSRRHQPTKSQIPLRLYLRQKEKVAKQESDARKAQFEEIVSPLWKFIRLVQYVCTAGAVGAFVFSGAIFLFSANNPMRREQAKSIATYAIFGLMLVWIAPYIVTVFQN